ncbi:MAG: methionyl-tRNA formyltransferase [Pelagibacterales bacterium]|nr:methionyl-tRNA formyltransferase [Pelagibacterales bacterium]|tara:strand:- start:7117 stop:7926 length:810 start_codon:yes stop_codon:yes gene_type:complete
MFNRMTLPYKITIFTSNQPRHISFIKSLQKITSNLSVVIESKNTFNSDDKNSLYNKYFTEMQLSENKIFGEAHLLNNKSEILFLAMNDLSKLSLDRLSFALQSDIYIVFGSSFIKGELCNFLISKKAINIHMGSAPYYRGAACNFWALYDNRPDMVGATIHYLSKGLDSGPIIFHALYNGTVKNIADLGMYSVKVAQDSIVSSIKNGNIFSLKSTVNNEDQLIRYSTKKEFSEEIIKEYYKAKRNIKEINYKIQNRDLKLFYNPMMHYN